MTEPDNTEPFTLKGDRPEIPVGYEQLRDKAQKSLPDEVFDTVHGGAGSEDTKRANREAFRDWRIMSRVLKDISDISLETSVLETDLEVPVMLAPVGVQSIVNEDAELAMARAAEEVGTTPVVSTVSSETLEDIAECLDDTSAWINIYWSDDWDVTESLISRAEKAGYEAVVITVDAPILGYRERDLQNAYSAVLEGDGLENYYNDPAFLERLDELPKENEIAAFENFVDIFADKELTWDDIKHIKEWTELPIILKGIVHPEDAKRAVNIGVDGIVVSNHGGRQIDGQVAALEALPEVVDAIDGEITCLFDSGIRRGADIIKALALGADAVLIGRPYLYGLAIDGQRGAQQVLENIIEDLETTIALTGKTDVDDLDRNILTQS